MKPKLKTLPPIKVTEEQRDALDSMVTDGVYPSLSEAVRTAIGRLISERSLSLRASGVSLKEQLEDHSCLRGVTCKEEA